MKRPHVWRIPVICFLLLFFFQTGLLSQRLGYSKEELTRRREALMNKLDEGMVVLFGDCLPTPGGHFR
jgi:hypothetical protein